MGKFSEKDRKTLLSNRYVENVTASHVVFTPEFKIKAVKMNIEGQSPSDIFNKLGIDTALFLEDFPKKSISRWKKIYLEEGDKGLKEERRGKKATGRPKRSIDLSDPDALRERIAYLEAENDFLKKLHALAAKYQDKKGSH